MKDKIKHLAYEIDLQPGERLTLPHALIESVGAGRWVITIEPARPDDTPIRGHGAFLNGYAEEDEGVSNSCSGEKLTLPPALTEGVGTEPVGQSDKSISDERIRQLQHLFAEWTDEDSKLTDTEADRLRTALDANRGLSFRSAQLD